MPGTPPPSRGAENAAAAPFPAKPDRLDALDDLAHDLGKHIRLPLSLLPEGASEGEVRAAIERGVLQTRSGPEGGRSAMALLQAFERLLSPNELIEVRALRASVEAAQGLTAGTTQPFDRSEARQCLARVALEIDAIKERWAAALGRGDDL